MKRLLTSASQGGGNDQTTSFVARHGKERVNPGEVRFDRVGARVDDHARSDLSSSACVVEMRSEGSIVIVNSKTDTTARSHGKDENAVPMHVHVSPVSMEREAQPDHTNFDVLARGTAVGDSETEYNRSNVYRQETGDAADCEFSAMHTNSLHQPHVEHEDSNTDVRLEIADVEEVIRETGSMFGDVPDGLCMQSPSWW